jgi:hypothetical protein
MLDSGTTDEGDTGTDVTASRVFTSSTTKIRIRSNSFAIISGNRFTAGCNSQRHISSGFAVVSF